MRFRERIALGCYFGAINLLLPIGILLGLPVFLLKRKRRKTVFKRLGFQCYPALGQKQKRPLWIHALSLGETLSCALLVEELRTRLGPHPIVFSVSTLSAMEIAQSRIKPIVDGLFYFPLDLWWPTRKVIRRIDPSLVVFIETDVWPGVQRQISQAQIPAVLVNGRLSTDTHKAFLRFKSLFAPALNCFEKIYPQSETEAQRFIDVGVQKDRLGQPGNLKFDVAARKPTVEEIRSLRQRIGLSESAAAFIAGSTHAGEEQIVLNAFEAVRKHSKDMRLILVPRHPNRAIEIEAEVRKQDFQTALYSRVSGAQQWDVLIVDVMGVLSKLYHLAVASFIGGSLVSEGGQNPLESAAAGCPVSFGQDMSDFPDISEWMIQEGAAKMIQNETQLAKYWISVLSDVKLRSTLQRSCLRIIEQHSGVTQKIAEEIASRIQLKR